LPCVELIGNSVLLTDEGWRASGSVDTELGLLGVNRRGELVSCRATLSSPGNRIVPVFVGTESTFGVFSPSTKLINRNGNAMPALGLAESGTIGDEWFENLLSSPATSLRDCSGQYVWDGLLEACALSREDSIAMRCWHNGEEDMPEAIDGVYTTLEAGVQRYCIIRKAGLQEYLAESGADALLAVTLAYAHAPHEEGEEFTRDAGLSLMWYLSALHELDIGHRVQYDSLQHTLYCHVRDADDVPRPVSRGGCACFANEMQPAKLLTWDSRGWKPVVSGFIASGD